MEASFSLWWSCSSPFWTETEQINIHFFFHSFLKEPCSKSFHNTRPTPSNQHSTSNTNQPISSSKANRWCRWLQKTLGLSLTTNKPLSKLLKVYDGIVYFIIHLFFILNWVLHKKCVFSYFTFPWLWEIC